MPAAELFRHDITVFKAAGGTDARQIPAGGATLDLYWKGARVSAPASGTVAVSITVNDPGTITANDIVKKNGVGELGTVLAVFGGAVTVTWGSLVSVDAGDRLIITQRAEGEARPVAYADVRAEASLGSQLTTGATNGLASFYTRPRDIDLVATVDGQTAVLPDQGGQGAAALDVYDFGLVGNGVADDAPALNRIVAYAARRGLRAEINLPAGVTAKLGSTWTINQPTIVRGAGRNAVFITGEAALSPMVDVTANNVTMESLTFTRTAAPSAGTRQLRTSGSQGLFRNLGFQYGRIGIEDKGTDNTFFDITFELTLWETFYLANQADGFHCYSMRGTSASAIAAANAAYVIDGGQCGRFVNCSADFAGAVDGRALLLAGSAVDPNANVFEGCKFVAAGSTTPAQPVVTLAAGTGARFIGCDLSDGLVGYHVNGTNDVQIIGGSVVGCQQNSVDIDDGSHVHILELLSSDNNLGSHSDHRADHINVAADVDDVSVIGLTVGKIVRTGGPDARHGVRVEAGASDNIQVLGVRGAPGDLTGAFISSASTSQSADIGHNFTTDGKTSIHTAVPGGYIANGQAGTKVIVGGSDTETSVANVSSIILLQGSSTVWTNLTQGREGQIVVIVNREPTYTATFTNGAVFQLNAASHVLTQDDTLTLMNVGSLWIQIAQSTAV